MLIKRIDCLGLTNLLLTAGVLLFSAATSFAQQIELGQVYEATRRVGTSDYIVRLVVTKEDNVPAPGGPVPLLNPRVFIFRVENPSSTNPTREAVHNTTTGEALNAKVLIGDIDAPEVVYVHGNFELSKKEGGSNPNLKLSGVLYIKGAKGVSFRGTGFRSLTNKFEALSASSLAAGTGGIKPSATTPPGVDPCTEDPDDMDLSPPTP